jgi:hypothetical protein
MDIIASMVSQLWSDLAIHSIPLRGARGGDRWWVCSSSRKDEKKRLMQTGMTFDNFDVT